MNNITVIETIQNKLYEYFIKNDNEWINIDKVNINRIDIDIVTSLNENFNKSKALVEEVLKTINKDLSKDERIYLGFFNIYSLEDAEFLGIEKPMKKMKSATSFSNILDNFENHLTYNKKEKLTKIISFYSYKGGVGRTIALTQTANLLAEEGKKVALIDMDIEAPSFNEIFSDDIQSENGLVNYLYNKLYDLQDIDITSIVSKLSLNTTGDVYVVPTGKINKKYVKMLESLKEKRISENEYIEKLIDELYKKYGVEYVLIDSRTGINNWGALSIGEIADEVILFAYPNKENVSGINLILDMIKDRKKCTVVFSRIDGTDAGRNNAKQYFKQIKIEDQQFIGIEYDSAIAVTSKYPIENKLNKFKCISDFILEDEINKSNNKWIKENSEEVNNALNTLENGTFFNEILTNDEMKFNDKSNYVILKDETINLNDIVSHNRANLIEFDFYNLKLDDIVKEKNIEFIINYLLSLAIVNSIKYINKENNLIPKEEVQKYYNDLKHEFNNKDSFLDVINKLDNLINVLEKELKSNIVYFAINIEDILDNVNTENFLNAVKNSSNNNLIENQMKLILLIIKLLNTSNKIQFKLVINENEYNKFENALKEVKANTLNLSWKNLNEDILVDKLKEVFNKTLPFLNVNNIIETNNLIFENNKDILFNIFKNNFIENNLIYCKRINSTKYSKEFILWLSEEIQEKKLLSKKYILDIIKESAKIEKENINENKTSIITFESFEKAINNIKNFI